MSANRTTPQSDVPPVAGESLVERARRDAEEAEYVAPASSIQRQMAAEVGRLMGLELDPLAVRDLGWNRPYCVAELDVAGVTFVGHYLSDTNGLHRTSSPFTVLRRRFLRTQRRSVARLGDLDGWLDA